MILKILIYENWTKMGKISSCVQQKDESPRRSFHKRNSKNARETFIGQKLDEDFTNLMWSSWIIWTLTIYLGLGFRINSFIFLMFHAFLVFAIGHHAHMSPLIHIDTLEHCTSSKIFIEKGQTSSQRQDLTCQQNCVILRSWYTFGVRG